MESQIHEIAENLDFSKPFKTIIEETSFGSFKDRKMETEKE